FLAAAEIRHPGPHCAVPALQPFHAVEPGPPESFVQYRSGANPGDAVEAGRIYYRLSLAIQLHSGRSVEARHELADSATLREGKPLRPIPEFEPAPARPDGRRR